MQQMHANLEGDVHGGVILRHIDESAGIAAHRHCRRRVVTAGVDRMTFDAPVKVGDLLVVEAQVNQTWNTSLECGVRVWAEDLSTGEQRRVASAFLTMVSLDVTGRPTAVPPIQFVDADDERRAQAAQLRRDGRLEERRRLQS
ncbi:MAG: acyl-CoA thioesterase [Actinobacteria bacterium]|nr:acyl-CoA thioesterase [Actinomycetota bacterium]